MQGEQVEIACEVRAQTEKALRIYDGAREVWIPRSQITDHSEEKGVIKTIFISAWIAKQKGLI